MNEVGFWARIDPLVERVLQAEDPWDTYECEMDITGEAQLDLALHEFASATYVLWADLSDLFDDPRLGRIPPEGAQAVGRRVASEWLSTPHSERPELIGRWNAQDLVALVEVAGFTVGPRCNPAVEDPWRGRWDDISWAIEKVGVTHTSYVAGERVVRETESDPVLWAAASGEALTGLLREWEAEKDRRVELESRINAHIRALRAEDVAPLQ